MSLLLIVFGLISIFELALWLPFFWRARRSLAIALIVPISVSSGLIAGNKFYSWALLLLVLSIYRVINLLRLVDGRMQADYLFHQARRTSLALLALQIVILIIAGLAFEAKTTITEWWYLAASLELMGAITLLGTLRHRLRASRAPELTEVIASKDLPSLTVAVPARNETTDLEACLASLVASTYPKLEILVLDDCSQNKQTSEVIRSFAHDGVRFVAGAAPPANWLAKNYAYQQLTAEASGSLLLFCGVDARFEPDSLSVMVKLMLQKRKSMLSFVPRNQLPGLWSLESLLVQPSRYAWEFVLPRKWLVRPAVLSTCWLITKDALQRAGGFAAAMRSSSPERYFARQAASFADGYSFTVAGPAEGLQSLKSFNEQRATAIRTRYPQLHRRPELVALVSLTELYLLLGPFLLVILAAASQRWLLLVISTVCSLLLLSIYGQVTALTYRQPVIRGWWLLPFAALYDVGLLNYSMWQYEFKEVIWKGRNVCLPVMHVIPALPKLKN